jgi:hypothetical protein
MPIIANVATGRSDRSIESKQNYSSAELRGKTKGIVYSSVSREG